MKYQIFKVGRENWTRHLVCALAALMFTTCSSTDAQYEYEEIDNFAANTTNLGEDEGQGNGSGEAEQSNSEGGDNFSYQNEAQGNKTSNLSNYENLLTDENIGEYVNNAGPESEGEPEQSLTANGDNLTGTGEVAGNTGMFGVDNSLPSNSIAKEVPANVVANTPSTETPTSALVEPQTTSPDPGVLNEDVYVPTEVLPSYATLWWVGYNFQREDKKLYIEIMTKGEPQYEIFQERNQASQPELVLRLLSTVMRPKMSRDIDASEFRSPVAYVRMREDTVEGHTDIVLTLRDASKPKFYAKDGNFLLTYDVAEKYLSPAVEVDPKQTEIAMLIGTEDVSPELESGTDMPKSAPTPQIPSNASGMPTDQGAALTELPVVDSQNQANIPLVTDMPESFGNSEPEVVSTVIPDAVPKNTPDVSPNLALNTAAPERAESLNSKKLPLVESPDTTEAIQKVPPGGGPSYYPQGYQTPYTQPYQQRYQPTAQYQQPYYQQPVYQVPLQQPVQPSGVAQPAEVAPPADDGDEVDGSGFEEDDSVDDFDIEDDVDDIEKFEVRLDDTEVFEILSDKHLSAVAQFDDYTAGGDFAATPDSVGGNYTGGDYNYEPNAVPAAEVTEIEGTTAETRTENYTGKVINLEFYRADIANVLRVFTDQTGINFVYPDNISRIQVSVKLKNVPWDAALKAILDSNDLAMTKVSDTIIKIDQNANIAAYLAQQNNLARQQALTIPTKTLVFRLSYSNAQTLVAPLTSILRDPNNILPVPNISSDDRTNSIIIEAIPQILSKAKAIIQRMDTPTLQAEIAARIVEVSKSATNFLGIGWDGGFNYDAGRGLGFGSLNFPNSITSQYAIDGTGPTGRVGQFNFRFGSINELIDLDLRLKMEEQMNNSETLQSQKIIVQDGESATILSGKTDRFRETQFLGVNGAAGAGAGDLVEVNIDVSLTLTNIQISNDDMITLPLAINSDSAAPAAGGSVSSSFRRQIQSTLVSRSGETVVIGGAYATTKSSSKLGVPFLSSLPIIGALFRQNSSVEDSKELLVMLTPNILSPERTGSKEIDTFAPSAAAASAAAEYNNANTYENAGAGNSVQANAQSNYNQSGNANEYGESDGNAEKNYSANEANTGANYGEASSYENTSANANYENAGQENTSNSGNESYNQESTNEPSEEEY